MVRAEGFQELAEHFVENEFEPQRGLIVPKRGMALRLSPMELRFEKMLRILVPQVASLTSRVRELEVRVGVGPAGEAGLPGGEEGPPGEKGPEEEKREDELENPDEGHRQGEGDEHMEKARASADVVGGA